MRNVDFILPVTIGVVGTSVSIFAAYTDYSMLGFGLSRAIEPVGKWQWFWISLGFTSASCLIPFFAYYFYPEDERALGQANAAYAFGVLWIPLLVVYPGTKALSVLSDESLVYAAGGILLSQYVVAKLLTKKIISENEQEA